MYNCIVSLTTWKKRINDPKLGHILFRVLKQQITNFKYKVVLVLSEEEFGKNFKLPKTLNLITQEKNFEILWTYKNTKALKKLDPVMQKYPDLPIITMDDDELIFINAIDTIMNIHLQYPEDILGTVYGKCNGLYRVGEFRLFPPNSLYNLNTTYFETYFNCLQDDEWNAIRAKLKGTTLRKVGVKLVERQLYGNQLCAFRKEYSKFNFKAAFNRFKAEHPEYKL